MFFIVAPILDVAARSTPQVLLFTKNCEANPSLSFSGKSGTKFAKNFRIFQEEPPNPAKTGLNERAER
jgi:hypothetical protein